MKKLIGTKDFYLMTLKIAVPIMVQMGITNFVGLLDNLMVGRIGTEQMTGVAVVNQLLFIFQICIFGGLSGAGIFASQFYGKNDKEGLQYVFRFKLIVAAFVSVAAIGILALFSTELIQLFLTDNGEGDVVATLHYGKEYLFYMLLSLAPFALKECYSSSLKETERTLYPMIGSSIAVALNFALNLILIFGYLGAPKMGVVGAAIATLVARVVELLFVVISAHLLKDTFFKGVYRSFRIPLCLVKELVIKGMPLLLNEALWSAGVTALNQSYSMRGLSVVTAINIMSTISNMFNFVFISLGSAIAIVVGKQLGASKFEEAKDSANKLIAFSTFSCVVMSILMILVSRFFVDFYKTSDSIKELAFVFIVVCAVAMPFDAFNHGCYFTLRSGGKTFITFLFDSAFSWLISIPVAQLLVRLTDLEIEPLFAICTSLCLIKCIIGFILVKKGIWVQNMVNKS